MVNIAIFTRPAAVADTTCRGLRMPQRAELIHHTRTGSRDTTSTRELDAGDGATSINRACWCPKWEPVVIRCWPGDSCVVRVVSGRAALRCSRQHPPGAERGRAGCMVALREHGSVRNEVAKALLSHASEPEREHRRPFWLSSYTSGDACTWSWPARVSASGGARIDGAKGLSHLQNTKLGPMTPQMSA